MSDCIFCSIIENKTNTEFVYEDDLLVVFKDIAPKADVHLLVVPKIHIKSLKETDSSHDEILLHVMKTLPIIAKKQNLDDGFRTILNTGRGGGQIVDHIHFHLLAGNLPSF